MNNKVHPDKETQVEGCKPTDTSQHNMELSALFEFRTIFKYRIGLTVWKSGELIAVMFATEPAQQLAGKMCEFTIKLSMRRRQR